MLRDMQKKIVTLMLLLMPFCVRAVVVPDRVVEVVGVITPILSSILSLAQSSHKEGHPVLVFSAGMVAGGIPYCFLHKYTHSQRIKKVQEALAVVKQSKIQDLLGLEIENITIEKINQIPNNGGDACIIAMQEACRCNKLLEDHVNWIDPVKDYQLMQELENHKKKIGTISVLIQTHNNGATFADMIQKGMLGNEKENIAMLKTVFKRCLWKSCCSFTIVFFWFMAIKFLWQIHLV